jgi:uncharacterized protein (DUF2141 family)
MIRGHLLNNLTLGATALALCFAAAPARANTVLVTVTGVRNSHGHVRVAICSKADFLKPHCAYTGKAPAATGDVLVTVENVPPGTYAAQAFHDEKDTGRIDRTLLGLPEQGMGFSNGARMFFGPPRFTAAQVTVADPVTRIVMPLRYF